MKGAWPRVQLGQLLQRSDETIPLLPDGTYREITVRLWGKGVVPRGTVTGIGVAASRRYLVRKGMLILSRIDARNGALGIVPPELDGAIATNDFPVFRLQEDRLLPGYLGWLCQTAAFVEECRRASEGTTNRVRLQEDKFLCGEIFLPPLSEQQRIVVRIGELTARVHAARALRHQTARELGALLQSAVSGIDRDLRRTSSITRLEAIASREKGSFRSGPFGSALLHSEFVSEGVPAIGIQNVQENRFEISRKWSVTREKAGTLKRYLIRPGDLLVTVMGTLGRACVVPDEIPDMVSTKHVWTITVDKQKADARWLSFWLNYSKVVREELLGQGTGTAIAGLNGKKLRRLSLPDISVANQRRIVAELDSLQAATDTLGQMQAKTAAELDTLLPAILDRAFKGEL